MFGAAATTDASELFWIVVLMIAGGWVLARSRRLWWAPPSGSRPSYPSESPSVLEMRAEGFEKTGDFDGAMEALLASHFAGSSQAVKLAHELSKRHPGAFQSKGCPVRLGVGSTPTPKQAGANTALASSVVSGGYGGGGCTAAPSEPLTAPSSVGHSAEQSGELASDVGPARAGEPTIAVAAPIAAAASDGQTPWERGWYGPVGFKPPPSDGAPPAAAVPAAAAAYDSISPTSENAPTSMKRGGTSGRRGRSGGSGNDIRVVWGGNSSSNATTAGLRNFTVAQLNGFDGGVPVPISRGGLVRSGKARPVYIALKGKVYDASSGNDLYGPVRTHAHTRAAVLMCNREVIRPVLLSQSECLETGCCCWLLLAAAVTSALAVVLLFVLLRWLDPFLVLQVYTKSTPLCSNMHLNLQLLYE